MMCSVRYFVHGAIESFLIRLRRLCESGKFSNELQRRGAYFIVGRGWRKVVKCFDGSTHERLLTTDLADENGFYFIHSVRGFYTNFFLRGLCFR